MGSLSAEFLLYCFAGVFAGTLVGVLPGLGPFAAISFFLPLVFSISDPILSIIFLCSLYFGTQYGGSLTSILLRIPGEPSSVVTMIDGYKLTEKGRAGKALAAAAISSFIGGIISIAFVYWFAEPLASLALKFGPIEYATLMFAGLITSVFVSNQSFLKGFGVLLIGIALSFIGLDINSGVERFTFGNPELSEGISFAILAMGVYGLAEVILNLFEKDINLKSKVAIGSIYPTKNELKEITYSSLRGTLIGSFIGTLPGGSNVLASFASYIVEKKIDKRNEVGEGSLKGVAAPESANNAASQTNLIPMLSLGLPITPVMSLLLSVFIFNGIDTGPLLFTNSSDIFFAIIGSMFVANIMLLILNLPMIPLWIKILQIPFKLLSVILIFVCFVGAYYISYSWFHVFMLIPLTILGIVLKMLDCEATPLAMGFILGSMFEEYLLRALTISEGSWLVFLESGISLSILLIVFILFLVSSILKKRSSYV